MSSISYQIATRWYFPYVLLIAVLSLYYRPTLLWFHQTDFSSADISSTTTCTTPKYTVRILSYEPLMMHIENFITLKERQHLLKLSEGNFSKSHVRLKNGTKALHPGRTSSSADIPEDDSVAACILQRASEFQGYVPTEDIELSVTSYRKGQEYKGHYDWKAKREPETCVVDRTTTFFGILEAQCSNCGTQFPKISVDWSDQDERWCRFVACDNENALTVLPIPGSAFFWRNLDDSGIGDLSTLHAGLPLRDGVKTGLNIWTKKNVQESFPAPTG